MKYCVKCGHLLDNRENFCTKCGMKQPFVPTKMLYSQPPAAPRNPVFLQPNAAPTYNSYIPVGNFAAKKTGAKPFIIWSLILVLFFNPIGTPLSMISALLSVFANASNNHIQRDRYLSIASVMCLFATFVDLLSIILLAVTAGTIIRIANIS